MSPSAPRREGEGGFTLLEVMIALAIMAGVVVTLLSSLNFHLDVASSRAGVCLAAIIGRAAVEEAAVTGASLAGEGDFGRAFEGYTWKGTAEKTELKGLVRRSFSVRKDGVEEVRFLFYTFEDAR
ncbi:MAG TPA: prepilin-type N-terminal cleavage/methylation domain-containing protein [Deltaproteobacteria bacterium]|nr:prepilin-type N-terminal cleavage/methylation domain-containing protein [Deltaproteobacteria bacterium]